MAHKKLKGNQGGYTFHAIIIGLVVIVAIGLVGWRVVSLHNKSNNVSSSKTMSKANLDYNCTTTKLVNLPDNSLTLEAPSCWKVNTYDSENIRIDSSNKYITTCLPGPAINPKAPCYSSDVYVYVGGGLPVTGYGNTQKWESNGYVLTTFQNQQAYCGNTSTKVSKSLPPNIPRNIPSGIFWGAGCYVLWNNYYYNIRVDQDPNFTDINQVYSLLGSIGFK